MNNALIIKSEDLFKRLEKIYKFYTKYKTYPYKEFNKTVDELKTLADSIPNIKNPQNQDKLIQSELKRRLKGEAAYLEQFLSGRYFDFDSVVSLYAIPRSDIEELRPWLDSNREKIIDVTEKLYKTKDIKSYELDVPWDVPNERSVAEKFAEIHVKKYHITIGKLLQDLTKVGEFLRDVDAVPTVAKRSYFYGLTKTLGLAMTEFCFIKEDKSLHVNERELIRLYGHEGMGHALNHLITLSNSLPYFLTRDSVLTKAAKESVAQFYQNVIFEDLKNSPETQRNLDIKHKFQEIYQEAKDVSQLREFDLKLNLYTITVLADKSLGNHKDQKTIEKKIQLIKEVTLDQSYPMRVVEGHSQNFDSRGNLNYHLVEELIYCAQPLQRALDMFKKQGMKYEGEERSKIDLVLLKGFWTPEGFVDNARLRAREMK